MILFNFKTTRDISNWKIVDDVVMGGRSNGSFGLTNNGFGNFHGNVSLENNGGFSIVKYTFDTKHVGDFSKVCIHVKGDGKTYQFRIKTSRDDEHSYVCQFSTSNDWEIIEIPFSNMQPTYRGRQLRMENYSGKQMEQIAFLIGNKKEESFKLEIESIEIK